MNTTISTANEEMLSSTPINIEFENFLRKIFSGISRTSYPSEMKTEKKDTVLPYELNNKKDFTKYLLTNGPYPMVLHGKSVKITYSQFTKGFYVINNNSIIIGEPLFCEVGENDLNQCISEWKASNKIFIRSDKVSADRIN